MSDEDVRPFRIGVLIILAIILNIKCNAEYPRIIEEIRFNDIFNVLLMLYFVACCYGTANSVYDKLIGELQKSKKKSTNEGFIADDEQDEKLPNNVKKYGEALIDQLMATVRNNKDSFAVGITGEWGSGKTTFLNLLKKILKDKAYIVDFNPWMCQTPEQLTRDFFSSLRHQLSSSHSSLSKPISHYAKHLDKVRVSLFKAIWLEGSEFVKSPSLYTLKSELSSKFETLTKPVVVFIDDLDRLESKEVFEVMRLIRNTGDIHNTIYLTAYDKEYVTAVLRENVCYNPTSYLEKIFPTEIHLPKPESHQIWEVFKEDLESQDNTGRNFANTLIRNFNESERSLISKILTSYRKAKRFSRLLMLNVNFVSRHYLMDFKYLDLFWIELLQFYDKPIYDSLARDVSVLLYYNRSTNRYHLRDGIYSNTKKDESHNYKGDKTWQPLTPRILEILFGDYSKVTSKSIGYPENYMKFFTIGLSAQKLTTNELNNLIDGKHKHTEVIDDWIKQGKYPSSIEYNLCQVKINDLSESGLSNFLKGVLYYALKKQTCKNKNIGFLNNSSFGFSLTA